MRTKDRESVEIVQTRRIRLVGVQGAYRLLIRVDGARWGREAVLYPVLT